MSQVSFKTIVPKLPVIVGESFRVQYVAENSNDIDNFIAPSFQGFRLVNGPEHYEGKAGFGAGAKKTYNTVYTLEAIKAGHYQVPGAVVMIDGKLMRSNDTWIEVISNDQLDLLQKQSTFPGDDPSYLKPGEDPYQKIRDNLFVKVKVDKKTCYPGEPIVATFQLYSRLQSSSDIIKNPGFYGFTIYDMINLADKEKSVENINGKFYDVHTIRKVQLYPLQPGAYTIDPMEIRNKVEFSRSIVSKKTEQKIYEGVFDEPGYNPTPGTDIFENTISTNTISINVKPVLAKNKPGLFNGATGSFTIKATIEKNNLAKNEEGFLMVTVSGKGNFTQLSAPVLNWPKGVEGFDPSVSDQLDKQSVPLAGSRTFRYAFVSASPGQYQLPAISFEYFDADSNKYKTATTKPVSIQIDNKEKEMSVVEEHKTSITATNKKVSMIAAGIILTLVLVAIIYWAWPKKEQPKTEIVQEKIRIADSVEELIKPALMLVPAAENEFYKTLQLSIWKFFEQRLHITGSEMSKQTLASALTKAGVANETILSVIQILSECEIGIFTRAELSSEKEMLAENTKSILREIDAALL